MPRSLFLPAAAAALLAVPWGGSAAAAQTAGVDGSGDAEAIVRRADQALAGLETLQAEFVQRVENPVLEKTTTGRGTLFYRAPDRFRIAYSQPAGDLIVNDGSHVWIYLPSSQPGQVIRQMAEASGVRNPLTYLRDLRHGRTVRAAGVETVGGQSAHHLILLASDPASDYGRIDVWVDRSSGLLRQVRTEGAEGVLSTYTFTRLEPGAAVDTALLRFPVPRGVEVFDQ